MAMTYQAACHQIKRREAMLRAITHRFIAAMVVLCCTGVAGVQNYPNRVVMPIPFTVDIAPDVIAHAMEPATIGVS
jgi:hypothetical protein